MTATDSVAADLKSKLSQAEARVRKLESSLEKAREDRDELAVTLRVLGKHGYMGAAETEAVTAGRGAEMNALQAVVIACVPGSGSPGITPKNVTAILHTAGRPDVSGDYVRTTLWRMAQRGVLKSENGQYWRIETPDAENVEAPDALTPRANNESTGPDTGRGTGFPPTPPEGSIPSGSTSHFTGGFADEMDDDIPF